MSDLFERVGQAADTVDNLLAAESLPIPESIAKQARSGSLESLRDELRAIYIEATGEDVWS